MKKVSIFTQNFKLKTKVVERLFLFLLINHYLNFVI
jgi:hypothetical protein